MGSEFEKWWEARYYTYPPNIQDRGLVRTQIMDAWNAALAAVEENMPDVAREHYPARLPDAARGWNHCLSTMSERIAALREKPE